MTFMATWAVLHEGRKKSRNEGGGERIPDQREKVGRFIEHIFKCKVWR